jgi:hypothetical protein
VLNAIFEIETLQGMALPCLLYGNEIWTLKRTDYRELEVAEMLFLRYVAGYTLWDKERRDEIRSQLGMKKTDKQIQERKKNWQEHLQSMPSERALKQILHYQSIGRHDPGRPRRRLVHDLMFEDGTG